MDIYPVDYSSDIGRVRKYIPDIIQLPDPKNPGAPESYMWSDDAIQSFIDDTASLALEEEASHPTILRAAASIMVATANNENLILKKIVTDDLQTDGPAVAKALIASAQELRARAKAAEDAHAEAETFIVVPNPFYGSYDWRN